MALKIAALLVLVAFTLDISAQDILYSGLSQYGHTAKDNHVKPIPLIPYQQNVHHKEKEDHHVEYKFNYAVNDEHTKDIKGQVEERKGDAVKGHYELIDSDGFKRIVEYTADDKNGFQAVVHRVKTDIVVPIPEHKEVHKEDDHGQYETYHKHSEHQDYAHSAPKHISPFKHAEEAFPPQPVQNIQKRHTSIRNNYVAPIYEN